MSHYDNDFTIKCSILECLKYCRLKQELQKQKPHISILLGALRFFVQISQLDNVNITSIIHVAILCMNVLLEYFVKNACSTYGFLFISLAASFFKSFIVSVVNIWSGPSDACNTSFLVASMSASANFTPAYF